MYKFINTFWDPQSKTVPVSHQSIHFQLLTTMKIVFYFHFHYFFMARILTHPFHTIHKYHSAIASISIAQNNRFWTNGRAVLSFSGHSKKKFTLPVCFTRQFQWISMFSAFFNFFQLFFFQIVSFYTRFFNSSSLTLSTFSRVSHSLSPFEFSLFFALVRPFSYFFLCVYEYAHI